jgi:hypothetical protein
MGNLKNASFHYAKNPSRFRTPGKIKKAERFKRPAFFYEVLKKFKVA